MAYDERIAQDEIELYKMDMLDIQADDFQAWIELMEVELGGDGDETRQSTKAR